MVTARRRPRRPVRGHRSPALRWLLVAVAGVAAVGCAVSPADSLVPPTADEDPALPQIDLQVGGHTRAVHLEVLGDDGAPVLFVLHGSLADYRSLRPLAVQLAERYRVVIWDQRGNGLSERVTAEEYTFDLIVDEIDALKQRTSPDAPITLVGHSFGAMYSALYISSRPEAVAQAVLLEPAGLNGDIFGATYQDIIAIDLLEDETNQTYWNNATLTPTDHAALDAKGLLILENEDQTNYYCDDQPFPRLPVWRPGVYVEYLRNELMAEGATDGALFGFDFSFGLAAFETPVLLVGGSCGALGADFQRTWHQALFPSAEVVQIDDAGHRMFVEQPEATFAALAGYLDAFVNAAP